MLVVRRQRGNVASRNQRGKKGRGWLKEDDGIAGCVWVSNDLKHHLGFPAYAPTNAAAQRMKPRMHQ